jgi:GntR family transcriptional regulator / MocR family aminotransferase
MRTALTHGVSCRAGERFFGDADQGRNYFRLAFPSVPLDAIDSGIEVVGDAISANLTRPGTAAQPSSR